MLHDTFISNQQTFFQKVRSMDYILLSCILLIGMLSCFAMYSSEGGEISFYTKNHAIRFIVFFIMMIFISFINIKRWFSLSYIFYFIFTT